MASMTGTKPTAIIKLPSIDKPKEMARTTEEDKHRILEKYKHRLNPQP